MADYHKIHALLWGAFSIGGIVSAFLLPVLILFNNIAFHPSGVLSADSITYDNMITRLANPLTKLYLAILLSTTLFHGLYRFRAFLFEIGLHKAKKPVSIIIYLIIAIGIIATLYYVFTIP